MKGDCVSIKTYIGVGSRETPKHVCEAFTWIGGFLHSKGFVLRSGNADGADMAFQGKRNSDEIYLPWNGFNNSKYSACPIKDECYSILKTVMGNSHFAKLSSGAKKLHGRNVYQVLGKELDNPSLFLICWTKRGETIGGTATAIKLAKLHGIPIINVGSLTMMNKNGIILFIIKRLLEMRFL
jgi:hypothetical protein